MAEAGVLWRPASSAVVMQCQKPRGALRLDHWVLPTLSPLAHPPWNIIKDDAFLRLLLPVPTSHHTTPPPSCLLLLQLPGEQPARMSAPADPVSLSPAPPYISNSTKHHALHSCFQVLSSLSPVADRCSSWPTSPSLRWRRCQSHLPQPGRSRWTTTMSRSRASWP